jgi:pilus assembly protein CpaF
VSALAGRVHARLLASHGPGTALGRESVAALVQQEAPLLAPAEVDVVVSEVLAQAVGLGPVDALLADPAVSEVMVCGPGRVWVERRGVLEREDLDLDGPAIEHLIEKVVGPLGLRVDRSSPMVDARLPDGSRVNAVVPPLAVDGPCITIRRFAAETLPLAAFCGPGVAALLGWAVRARMNLLVAGATSSGKTTLLNALAGEIPAGERIVTVEDAAELRLPQEHVVRLEARPPNADGAGQVRVRDLVRNALRMRPDRIVVGEVRDAAALDMLQAMNTGHEGSLSTCHANGAADALRRLETMVLMGDVALPLDAVRDQVVSSLDLVVQVARRPGGARRVVEVAEVADPAGSPPAAGGRAGVVRLAGASTLRRLPSRPARAPGAPALDPAWVGT